MKKLIKKVLIETLEDKKLQMAYVYLINYLNSLEEFVDDNGNIFFREYGSELNDVLIKKNELKCLVSFSFWKEFSQFFSLKQDEVKSVIIKWVENNYNLKNVYIDQVYLIFN